MNTVPIDFLFLLEHTSFFSKKNAEKDKGFQNGMVQDPHAPLKLNFASVSEMVDKDAGSPSLSIIVPPWDFEGRL